MRDMNGGNRAGDERDRRKEKGERETGRGGKAKERQRGKDERKKGR